MNYRAMSVLGLALTAAGTVGFVWLEARVRALERRRPVVVPPLDLSSLWARPQGSDRDSSSEFWADREAERGDREDSSEGDSDRARDAEWMEFVDGLDRVGRKMSDPPEAGCATTCSAR